MNLAGTVTFLWSTFPGILQITVEFTKLYTFTFSWKRHLQKGIYAKRLFDSKLSGSTFPQKLQISGFLFDPARTPTQTHSPVFLPCCTTDRHVFQNMKNVLKNSPPSPNLLSSLPFWHIFDASSYFKLLSNGYHPPSSPPPSPNLRIFSVFNIIINLFIFHIMKDAYNMFSNN